MPHVFQVGEMVKLKDDYVHGDNGCPSLGVAFDIDSYDDPKNYFIITTIHDDRCNSERCRKSFGCYGPIVVRQVTTDRILNKDGFCLGYDEGMAFESCGMEAKLIEAFERLGIESGSNNRRHEPNKHIT